jgi:hypothetical protein
MKGINQEQAVTILPDFCGKLEKVPNVSGFKSFRSLLLNNLNPLSPNL